MKLNLGIISERLPDTYRIRHMGQTEHKLRLARPRIYESGNPMETDAFYVARADTLPKKPPSDIAAVVCVGGLPPEAWSSSSLSQMVITDTSSLFSVFDDICKIYDYFDKWERELLTELANSDADLLKIVRLGIEAMGNPLILMNKSLRVVMSSAITKEDNGGDLVDVVPGGRYASRDPHIYDKIKECCTIERQLKTPFISSFLRNTEFATESKSYCINMHLSGNFVGCALFYESNRTFNSHSLAIADFYFPYLERAFLRYLLKFSNSSDPHNTAFVNLLNHKQLSADEHEQLNLSEEEVWVCFQLRPLTVNYMPIDYMCAVLKATMTDTVLLGNYQDKVLGIVKCPHDTWRSSPQLATFDDLAKRMGYKGGFSIPFGDYKKIGYYLEQAEFALSENLESSGKKHFFYFEEHILDYMVEACFDTLPFQLLCTEALSQLIDYDRRRSSELLKTLDTYLYYEGSLSKTSTALYIHRTSLLKRLERIEALTKCSLDDAGIRLYYRICLAKLKRDGFKI